MNVLFSPQEEAAIGQMAQMADISPEAIVIQSVRMYQLWKMNRVSLVWPKVLDCKLYESEHIQSESPEMYTKDSVPEPPSCDESCCESPHKE